MPIAPSRGARIHYRVHGESDRGAPPVVLLQGLGLSSRFWFDIPELLASNVERPRQIIAIDNRGTGGSDRPRRLWTMGTMADDVAAVLDHAGASTAVVVGISMGGMIAQHVALRHPSRVSGLVLLATTPGFLGGAMPEPLAMMRLLSLGLGGRRAVRNLSRVLLPEAQWPRAGEILREWPRAMSEDPLSRGTFVAQCFAVSLHFVVPRLAAIACPAVIVAGAEDALVPARNAAVLAERIPRAHLEIVPGAAHAVFADDRDLVRRMIARLESPPVAQPLDPSTASL